MPPVRQEARDGSSPRPSTGWGRLPASSVGLAALLAVVVASGGVAAQVGQSLGVTPPDHEVTSAIQGETYQRQVTVQNEFDSVTTVTLETSGELAEWTTTSPASGFEVPPRTHSPIDLEIAVPEDAVNGTYEGKLHVTAEPKEQPDGSGAAIRYSVAVLLSVQVGGEPVHDVGFSSGTATDVEEGTPPDVDVTVTNGGNVRDTATACAAVFPFHGDDAIAHVRDSTTVLPGEQAQLSFSFQEILPQGQYRVQILPNCETDGTSLDEASSFKVVPPGTLGKDGILRFIEHSPAAGAGRPVEVTGVFENVGEADLARATFTCKVYKDGQLVDVLETEPRFVGVGEEVELTSFFTPEEPGRYELVGTVTYDGFESEERESFVTAQGSAASPASTSWLGSLGPYLILAALVIGLAVLVYRWRRDDGPPEAPTASGPTDGADDELETADVEAL